MKESTYRAHNGGASQCAIILKALKKQKGRWVPLRYLMRIACSAAVHSRIAELRRHGHVIRNRTTPPCRPPVRSWYQLA